MLAAGLLVFPIAIAAGAILGALGAVTLVTGGMLASIFGVAMVISTWRANERQVPMPGRLEAGEAGVTWNGRLLAARRRLPAGFVIPGNGGGAPLVRLVRRFRRPLTFLVPDEDTGRALLSALGLDAAQTSVSIKLASLLRNSRSTPVGEPRLRRGSSCPGSPSPLALASGPIVVSRPPGAGGADLVHPQRRPGARPDRRRLGVLVKWLWVRRFVPFDDFDAVGIYIEPSKAGIVITPAQRRARCGCRRWASSPWRIAREELTLIGKRIEQGADFYRHAQADKSVVLPGRGERAAGAWIHALRAVGSGANADHRTAPVAPATPSSASPRTRRQRPGPARRRRRGALGGVLDEAAWCGASAWPPRRPPPRSRARRFRELAVAEAASDEALAAALDRLSVSRARA